MLILSKKRQSTTNTNNENDITVLAFLPESGGPSGDSQKRKLSLLTFWSPKSLLVSQEFSVSGAPVSESWKTVTSERVTFDNCILHTIISDIFQNFHMFFLVLQSSLDLLPNYYGVILLGISPEKIRHKESLWWKNHNNLRICYFQTSQNQTIICWKI